MISARWVRTRYDHQMPTDLATLFNTLPADQLLKAAQERVLSFPQLSLGQLIYVDERLPLEEFARSLRRQHLIVLENDGDWSCPAFQFNSDGKPLGIVIRVNQMLAADEDPWGVASWWISSNARVHENKSPLQVLEEDRQPLLLALAHAILEPVG